MKIFSYVFAAIAALALLCGCDHSLDYVPDDAEIVAYGNTKALLNTKLWKTIEKKDDLGKHIMEALNEAIGIKEIGELSGNITVWGRSLDTLDSAVIVLDNRKAAEVLKDAAAKLKASDPELKEVTIDGCPALVMASPASADKMTVIAAGKKVLHIALRQEAKAAFKKNSGNPLAKAIDRDAVIGVACSPKAYENLDKSASDIQGIGISVIHVYVSNKEIKLKASVDISDVK